MSYINKHIAAACWLALLSPLAALASHSAMPTDHALGNPAAAGAASRTIVITPATRSVNVEKDDVITFTADGKSFTWQFDTLRDDVSFELGAIAPKDFSAQAARVHVASNSLYRN